MNEIPETPPAETAIDAVATPAPSDAVVVAAEAVVGAADAGAEAVADAAPAAVPAANELATPAAVAAKLRALFPALFTGSGPFKPLKLRVQADIQERAPGVFTKAQLSAYFRRYTGSTGYLIALSKATHRFDLEGQEAGELSDEHRNAAKEELTRRKGLQQERVTAEREQEALLVQQRRNRAGLLYDFERTTLTEANFCVLKGVVPEELPGLLEIARKERAEAPPPQQPQLQHREPRRDDRRPANPGDRRGPPRGGRPPQANKR